MVAGVSSSRRGAGRFGRAIATRVGLLKARQGREQWPEGYPFSLIAVALWPRRRFTAESRSRYRVFTPKGLYITAGGRAAPPRNATTIPSRLPRRGGTRAHRRVVQPLRGRTSCGGRTFPGVRCAPPGRDVQPLRGKDRARLIRPAASPAFPLVNPHTRTHSRSTACGTGRRPHAAVPRP